MTGVTFDREPQRELKRPTRYEPAHGFPNQDIQMSATRAPSPFDTEQPLTYSLDGRGPNDPRFGSIHVVLLVLTAALAAATFLVL